MLPTNHLDHDNCRNVYAEKSKADDVQFILDIIAKIGAEVPAADMNNVNIAGSSNGAALTYQLLINTGADRPFRRAFPMVSSLIGPQYNNDQFWKFSQSAAAGSANNFDTAVTPAFDDKFEVILLTIMYFMFAFKYLSNNKFHFNFY